MLRFTSLDPSMNTSQRPNTREPAFLVEQAIQLFGDLVARDEALELEFLASRREFIAATAGDLDEAFDGDSSRARRHLEWFLFDRQNKHLGGLPFEALMNDWRALAAELPEGLGDEMLQTILGIFEVVECSPRGAIELRELAGLTKLTLGAQASLAGLAPGDLLVGRFFPFADGLHEPSSALGFFRNPDLLDALQADLSRLREQRAHAVMRLSQSELERMFWPYSEPASEDPQELDPVGDLERFFRGNGITMQTIESWKRTLANNAPDTTALASGTNDLVGVLLEQLAFDTQIDLKEARAHLLAAWPALCMPRAARAPEQADDEEVQAPASIATSLQEFDRDRAAGIDVDTSFRELELRLGLGGEDPEEDTSAPDFPGVVGAMVAEFLWEVSLASDGPANDTERQAWSEGLGLFAEYTSNIGVFENLGERELLGFLTFWLPESRRLQEGARASEVARAMDAFARWAQREHEVVMLAGELAEGLDELREALARAVDANAQLAATADATGELFEYCGSPQSGSGMIRDEQGEERQIALDAALLALLNEGDLLRGYTSDEGVFVVGCCYPPQARGLRQRLIQD